MNIVSLAKVVPDYEISANEFEIENNRAHKRYNRMIGLYDESALELAIQLKEKYEGDIKVISYCNAKDVPVLRKAIAMGCDDLIAICGEEEDPEVIASNLVMAIEKIGKVDIILAGRQSSDLDRGIIPGYLAGKLNIPFIPNIIKVEKKENKFMVTQVSEKGTNVLIVKRPVVLSITDDISIKPRIPKVKGILMAKKKSVEILEEKRKKGLSIKEIKVEIPKNEYFCEILPLENVDETASLLWKKLKEEKYI